MHAVVNEARRTLEPERPIVARELSRTFVVHATDYVLTVIGAAVDRILRDKAPQVCVRFVKYWERDGRRFAPYSDDTQMSEIVLRSLLWRHKRDADLDTTMKHIAQYFILWCYKPVGGPRAPGNSCMAGCRALYSGVPWQEAGGENAGGCGSVMRVYPFALAFARDPDRAEEWAVAHSALTHRAPIALAACAAMTRGMLAV
jgi:ADP-ribosylglycohydrolase